MLLVYNIEMKTAQCVIFNFPSPHKYAYIQYPLTYQGIEQRFNYIYSI